MNLSRLVRAPLMLIPKPARVPIAWGPLRGARWIVGSGTHGYWLGTYERLRQKQLQGLLTPGDVFFDVGANVGFYTLLGSRRVGDEGKVFAFEPLPRNLRYLREHVRLNDVRNVSVIGKAVSDVAGALRFSEAPSSAMGRLDADGSLEVQAVSLDELVLSGELPPPRVIKMDIEGGEDAALAGARGTLLAHKPVLLLSSHGWAKHQKCCDLLKDMNYQVDTEPGGEATGNYESLARYIS